MKGILLQFDLIFEDLKGVFETRGVLENNPELSDIDESITVLIADLNE